MKKRHARTTFRTRVMGLVLGVSAVSLIVALVGIGGYTMSFYRDTIVHQRTAEASILAHNLASALAFMDPDFAERTLGSLRAEPQILRACLYTPTGEVFASHFNPAVNRHCPPVGVHSTSFLGDVLRVVVEVRLHETLVGKLLMESETHLGAHMSRYVAISLGAFVLSLVLAFAVSAWLQRRITKPIASLVEAAHRVTREQDFSVRAQTHQDDELGALADTFNEMLERMEKTNNALRRNKERYERLYNTPLVGMMRLSGDASKVLMANQAAATLLGYASAAQLSKDFVPQMHDAGGANTLLDELGDRDFVEQRELRFRDREGRERWALASFRTLDGDQIEAVFVDITTNKLLENELSQLEAQIRQQQKLESIGTLASGVAHEINNPMQAILGHAELLELEVSDELQPMVREITKHCERVARIVGQLLAFARVAPQESAPESVEDIVRETIELSRPLLKRDRIRVTMSLHGNLPPLRCRRQQIEQVLLNLVTNARDALVGAEIPDERRTIEISASVRSGSHGNNLMITVQDWGPGIAVENQERLFDPFFTTKGRNGGTGLGLSVSHGIIQDHDGRIWVESERDAGTVFTLEFPIGSELAPPQTEADLTA